MASGVIRTTCPYCGVGCGVARRRTATIAGDPDHPANLGRLCSKGAALAETLDDDGRLLHPQIGGRAASWDEALDLIAAQLRAKPSPQHGPDSVAFYVSGQFLTEDYYVANKLMKGFIGSGNIDTNSRLCMASSVAGHVRAFGEDVVPGCYEDIETGRSRRAGRQQHRLVPSGAVISGLPPRKQRAARESSSSILAAPRPATSPISIWRIRPGTDVALFSGLLVHLARRGALRRAWMRAHADGLCRGARGRPQMTPLGRGCRAAICRRRREAIWDVSTTCSPRPSAR